jgi:predicted RNase H-like nuclease
MTTIGGADGCSGGWICVQRDTVTGEIFAEVLTTTKDLRDRARHLAVLTVDIPIGPSKQVPGNAMSRPVGC